MKKQLWFKDFQHVAGVVDWQRLGVTEINGVLYLRISSPELRPRVSPTGTQHDMEKSCRQEFSVKLMIPDLDRKLFSHDCLSIPPTGCF